MTKCCKKFFLFSSFCFVSVLTARRRLLWRWGWGCALTLGNPFPQLTGKRATYLLQASVVMLGFGMNLEAVYKAGKSGIAFIVAVISSALVLGFLFGRFLKLSPRITTLVSTGTAICGGSAIAAVGPAIKAENDEMSVSLGTIFVLNAVALFAFPFIGHSLDMSQNQFGMWAAIAIQDTSSVVGASSAYGPRHLRSRQLLNWHERSGSHRWHWHLRLSFARKTRRQRS